MRAALVGFFFLTALGAFGQVIVSSPVMELSRNELLGVDAFKILKANKYLDFKAADTLTQWIDGKIFKKISLSNYFGYPKNWAKIENEDSTTYKRQQGQQADPKYVYQHDQNSMTESYTEYGTYGVRKDYRLVYDPKGFLLIHEVKVFLNNTFVETRLSTTTYDEKHRAVLIIERLEKKGAKAVMEERITASYEDDAILVKSTQGLVRCVFAVKMPKAMPIALPMDVVDGPDVYRFFIGTNGPGLTLKLLNDTVVVSRTDQGKPITVATALHRTTDPKLFYIDQRKTGIQTNANGTYILFKLDREHRKLELFVDTAFASKAAVAAFLPQQHLLGMAMCYQLIAGLSPQAFKALPSILAMTKADQLKMKKLDDERAAQVEAFDQANRLTPHQRLKLSAKQAQLVLFNCLYLGYMYPQDQAEWNFLRTVINDK